MTWVAVAVAGAAVVGGAVASNDADKALDAQEGQLEDNAAFIKQQSALARGDALPLFDAASQNRQLGFQGALDIIGETVPQQFNAFQQGNLGAQQALLTGQQQAQNAILGLPAGLAGIQPQALPFDASFAQQQLPQFTSGAGDILGDESTSAALADANAQFSPETIQAILGSGRFPQLTNEVTRSLGDIGQIRPGAFQQFLADRPRVGKFFRGEAMNIAQREGILPSPIANPLSGINSNTGGF